jgi:hypothetical protein
MLTFLTALVLTVPGLAPPAPQPLGCTSTIIFQNGRTVTCMTCCSNGVCNTTCN